MAPNGIYPVAIRTALEVAVELKDEGMKTSYMLSCIGEWKRSSINLELKKECFLGLWNAPQDRIKTNLVEDSHKDSIPDKKDRDGDIDLHWP